MKIVPYNPEYHDELTQMLREYLVFTGEVYSSSTLEPRD